MRALKAAGRQIAAAAIFALHATIAAAGITDTASQWYQSARDEVTNVYDNGRPNLFIDGYTWHDPHTYTAAKRATLNSHGWGLGWGKHLSEGPNDDRMVYGMVFSDSHRDPEPVLGYARQWLWRPLDGKLRLGAGYTAGLTMRSDTLHYMPFPIVLPLASLGYGPLTLYGVFIPRLSGTPNNGNVAFLFLRYTYQ